MPARGPRWPAPRRASGTAGTPENFGKVAAFLCSDAAKYVTGTAIPVDGGAYSGLQ